MHYEQFDVVVVPFPFTSANTPKRRPALVLPGPQAFTTLEGYSVMAMISAASHEPWPLDVTITDLESTGLGVPSLVRMKLFTLANASILRHIGHLGTADQNAVQESLNRLFLELSLRNSKR